MQDLFPILLGALPAVTLADAMGDEDTIALIITVLFYGALLSLPVVGIVSGRIIEANHFKSLARREGEFADILVTDVKTPPAGQTWEHPCLVSGSAVIATDYFKTFAAGFRKLFGGEFKGLKRMQDRARREALLRMLAEARNLGAEAVCNVRIETATIGGKSRKKIAGVEILAFGTALVRGAEAASPPAAQTTGPPDLPKQPEGPQPSPFEQ